MTKPQRIETVQVVKAIRFNDFQLPVEVAEQLAKILRTIGKWPLNETIDLYTNNLKWDPPTEDSPYTLSHFRKELEQAIYGQAVEE